MIVFCFTFPDPPTLTLLHVSTSSAPTKSPAVATTSSSGEKEDDEEESESRLEKVREGELVQLKCIVDSNPAVQRVDWYYKVRKVPFFPWKPSEE